MKELERKSDMYIYIYIYTDAIRSNWYCTYNMKPQK